MYEFLSATSANCATSILSTKLYHALVHFYVRNNSGTLVDNTKNRSEREKKGKFRQNESKGYKLYKQH